MVTTTEATPPRAADVADGLCCPLTLAAFEDAVVAPCCGTSCSRGALRLALDADAARRCPMCRADLSRFDVDAAPPNRALMALVAAALEVPPPPPPPPRDEVQQSHRWSATLHPVPGAGNVARLALRVDDCRFTPRTALFCAVVDSSGSMSGSPWRQVQAALRHIAGAGLASDATDIAVIQYESSARRIDTSGGVDAVRQRIAALHAGGGTSFTAAFGAMRSVLADAAARPQRYGSIAFAFLTDGQAFEPRDGLVEQLRAVIAEHATPDCPVTVHAVGFSASCDRPLLEGMRCAGTAEGAFRYAEPTDSDDALCGKLTGVFECACRGATTQVTAQLREAGLAAVDNADDTVALHVAVDKAARTGTATAWVRLLPDGPPPSARRIELASECDRSVHVPVAVAATAVGDATHLAWLRTRLDRLAAECLAVATAEGAAAAAPHVRELHLGLLEQQLDAIAARLPADGGDATHVAALREQMAQLRSGRAANAGKLSDLRFASQFAAPVAHARPAVPTTAFAAPPAAAPASRPAVEARERPVPRLCHASQPHRGALANAIMAAHVRTPAALLSQARAAADAELAAADADGNMCLHLAAYCGQRATVRALLEHRALAPGGAAHHTLDAANAAGETPLTLAVKHRGYHDVAALLAAAGACVAADRVAGLQEFVHARRYVRTAALVAGFATGGQGPAAGSGAAAVALPVFTPAMQADFVRFRYAAVAGSVPADAPLPCSSDRALPSLVAAALQHTLTDVLADVVARHGAACVAASIDTDAVFISCFPPKADHADTAAYLALLQLVLSIVPGIKDARRAATGDTLLIRAVDAGSRPHVVWLLDHVGVDVDGTNALGNTALWVACAKRYPCIIDELLARGADPNHSNGKGNVPLSALCQTPAPAKIAEALLAAGADPAHVNRNGDSLVLLAARNGQSDALRLLLHYCDAAAALRHVAHIDGFNALFAAVEGDRAECVRVLHEHGAGLDDTTAVDNAILPGGTPLHLAAYYGRMACAELLLELGAQGDVRDAAGMTPLHVAVIRGHAAMAALCVHRGGCSAAATDEAGNTPLAYCRGGADGEALRRLLQGPATAALLSFATGAGWSSTDVAAARAVLERCAGVVGVLSPRAAVDVADDNGETPLLAAVVAGHAAAAEALIHVGADPTRVDRAGVPVAAWAAWLRNPRVLQAVAGRDGPSDPSRLPAVAALNAAAARDAPSRMALFVAPPPRATPDDAATAASVAQMAATALQDKMTIGAARLASARACGEAGPVRRDSATPCGSPWRLLEAAAADGKARRPAAATAAEGVPAPLVDALVRAAKLSAVRWTAAQCCTALTPVELATLHLHTSSALPARLLASDETSEGGAAAAAFAATVDAALRKLPPLAADSETYLACDGVPQLRSALRPGACVTATDALPTTTMWPTAVAALRDFSAAGTVLIVKAATARLVAPFAAQRSAMEAAVPAGTRLRVAAWYRGDVIALGQPNIRHHSFGLTDGASLPERDMARYVASTRPLIIELVAEASGERDHAR